MQSLQENQTAENDLVNWLTNIKVQEKELCEEKELFSNKCNFLPGIRNLNQIKSKATKPVKDKKKLKNVSFCDYDAWDKYDCDTELNRIDLQQEQKQVQAKRAQQGKKEREENYKHLSQEDIKKTSLTETELSVMAEMERLKGNEAYKIEEFHQALKHYNSSLSLYPSISCYNNRAITYIKLHEYSKAYEDSCRVINEDPNNIKGLYRRGMALEGLQEKSKALRDYQTILSMEPDNRVVKLAVQKLERILSKKSV